MDLLPGISNINRRAYIKTAHIPLDKHQQREEMQKLRKYNNLIKQKNYLSAKLLLHDESSFLSDILPNCDKRAKLHSAPAYTIQDLSKYSSLVEQSAINQRPQTQKNRTELPPLYRISHGENGDVEITPHITLANLCDNLKQKGLGDPRDHAKPRPPDPLPLLRRRRRQEKKYPSFYREKLQGRALQDLDLTNSKAMAFIEQHKQGNIRTVSANWRERYNNMQAFGKVSRDSDMSLSDSVQFADWDEDHKPKQLDEQSCMRIQTWLTEVQQTLFASDKKQ